jgi:hypothetical protein
MIIYTCVAQQDEMASFKEAIILTRQAIINAQLTMSAMKRQLTVMTLNEMGAAPEQITQALLELQQAKSAMGRHFDADLLFVNSEVEIFRIQHNAASRGCTAFYDDDLAAMRIQISNDAKRKCEAIMIDFGFFGSPCSSAGPSGVGEQDAREVGGYDDDEAD